MSLRVIFEFHVVYKNKVGSNQQYSKQGGCRMYLQHCLIVHLLWSTDIMRGNQGTSCLLGIPTPGPFFCLKLDCSAFVLVTGGDCLVPCVVRVLV